MARKNLNGIIGGALLGASFMKKNGYGPFSKDESSASAGDYANSFSRNSSSQTKAEDAGYDYGSSNAEMSDSGKAMDAAASSAVKEDEIEMANGGMVGDPRYYGKKGFANGGMVGKKKC